MVYRLASSQLTVGRAEKSTLKHLALEEISGQHWLYTTFLIAMAVVARLLRFFPYGSCSKRKRRVLIPDVTDQVSQTSTFSFPALGRDPH